MDKPSTTRKAAFPWIISLLAVFLLAYSSIRGVVLSITHDEANTFLWFAEVPFLQFFSDATLWASANNHLLNTLAMQWSIALFGVSEWSIRLPNLFFHAVYLVATGWLVYQLSGNRLFRVVGFLCLNANPYMLDFFSLARGYGMVVALSMISLLAVWGYFKRGDHRYLGLAFLFAALGVLANFVGINYYMALWLNVIVFQWLQITPNHHGWRGIIILQGYPLFFFIALAGLLWVPLQSLQQVGDFGFGAPSLWHGFYTMVESTLYRNKYLGSGTFTIATLIYGLLMVLVMVTGMRKYIKEPRNDAHFYLAFTIGLLLSSILVMVVQNVVLGSQYLDYRKTILWIWLSAMIFCLGIHLYMTSTPKLAKQQTAFGWMFIVLVVFHFVRAGNFSHCLEWDYDQKTKAAMTYLQKLDKTNHNPTLAVDWCFFPSTQFYFQTLQIEHIQPPPYLEERKLEQAYHYYFLLENEARHQIGSYARVKFFSPGMGLYKWPPTDQN